MFEKVWVVIVIVGLTSLVVIWYYNRILKNFLHTLYKLFELQENRSDDVESYIQNIALHVRTVGVKHLYYNISYLNKTISNVSTDLDTHNTLRKDIYYKNINGYLLIETDKKSGEYTIINKLILFILTLQIVNAVHTDIEKINESFARIAKLQTYMMHDLKNILQFFQAMHYNIERIDSLEQQANFIDFLKNSTKPIDMKVNKILSLLQVESALNQTPVISTFLLQELVESLADQYSLACTVKADVAVKTDKELLRTVLENILSNIAYKKVDKPDIKCFVYVEETTNTVAMMIQDDAEPFQNPLHVTQPFYTTKQEGLGIGMYQAKSIMQQLGGTLTCNNIDEKATVTITIPKV